MKNRLILTDENGKKIKCDVVARWKNNKTDYIAYTDGSMDGEELNIYLSKCINDNGNLKVFDIVDDYEWEEANNYLCKILNESGDEDIE